MLKRRVAIFLVLSAMFVTFLPPHTASAGVKIPEASLILSPPKVTYSDGEVVQYGFSVTPVEGFTYEATICMPSGVCYDLTGPDGQGAEGTVVMEAGPDVGQTIVTKYNDIGEIVAQDRTDFAVVPAQEPPTAPDITEFDPHRGPIGTLVTIRGTNFEDVNEVRFNLRIAQFTVLSPTRILFRVPARAQTGTITVFSPDGSDATSDVFRVRRDEHRSTIKFKVKKHLVAAGVVRATDGARVCMTQRRVIVQRRVGGSWRAVRSDRTRATGKYRIRLLDTAGTYRAIVKQKATIRGICSGDESNARRHRHRSKRWR